MITSWGTAQPHIIFDQSMGTPCMGSGCIADMADQQIIRLSREVERLVTALYAPSLQVNSAAPRECLRSMR
jgi:hypothetical protein